MNDDICDCPDGSDEPGTAACPGNFFYCENVGHIPGKLPSSRVNDGVYDYDICCDGSDEAGLSNLNAIALKCENKCKEINARFVAEKKKLAAIQEAGLKTRAQLVVKAKKLRENLETDLKKTEVKVANLNSLISQKELKLKELLTVSSISSAFTSNDNSPEDIIKAKTDLQQLEQKYLSALDIIKKIQEDVVAYELILRTMKTDYNPNFNDPAVKNAIRLFEELKANADPTIGENTAQLIESKSKFSKVIANISAIKCPTCEITHEKSSILPTWVQNQLFSLKTWLIDNGLLADPSFNPMGVTESGGSKTESAEITLLQNMINKHKTELTKANSELESIKNDISGNFGRNEVLRSLKNTCVSNHLGEYTYEFCFSGQAFQKGNGQNTNLGTFDSLKYSDDSKSLTLNFEKGSKCWSGPIRRTSVEIVCGSQNELLSVSEPERCEYFFKARSPIACLPSEQDNTPPGKLKDEL